MKEAQGEIFKANSDGANKKKSWLRTYDFYSRDDKGDLIYAHVKQTGVIVSVLI